MQLTLARILADESHLISDEQKSPIARIRDAVGSLSTQLNVYNDAGTPTSAHLPAQYKKETAEPCLSHLASIENPCWFVNGQSGRGKSYIQASRCARALGYGDDPLTHVSMCSNTGTPTLTAA